MGVVNLNNPRLRELIRRNLDIERYGEPFSTLIEEIFMREQFELQLSPEELLEDLNNFKHAVNRIYFADIKNSHTMGVFSPSRKEIVLNKKYWENIKRKYPLEVYYSKLFETIAHECLHGAQEDCKKHCNRAGGYNHEIDNRAHAIYEICTQATAARIANDRLESDMENNIILSGDGYSDEIFAIPLIAATFGVSENEVLKYGQRERDKLVQVLNKNIGNIVRTQGLVREIELQLEYIHSINYPDNDQEEYINLTNSQRREKTTDAIIKLTQACQAALVCRIKNTPLNFSKDMAIQYKYDQKKINDTLEQEFYNYGDNFNKKYQDFLNIAKLGKSARYIDEAINVFNQIGKNENGVAKYSQELVKAVINEDFENCRRKGIRLQDGLTYSLFINARNFKEKKAYEEYKGFNNWDNTVIYDAFSNKFLCKVEYYEIRKDLKEWKTVYSEEGIKKINQLKSALIGTYMKYGVDSKYKLLDFFETSQENMDEFYRNFTEDYDARANFRAGFRTKDDKEFLAKLMAEKYLEKYFNEDGSFKDVDTQEERDFQEMFEPTINNQNINGREQFVWAIAQVFVNEYYQGFSDESCIQNLYIYGKKGIYDIVSQPLIDEILLSNELKQSQKLEQSKKDVLQTSVYETEKKYPGSMNNRISNLVLGYRINGTINSRFFTSKGRENFEKSFKSDSDMEDIMEIICGEYTKNYLNKNMENGEPLDKFTLLMYNIIVEHGEEYLKKNLSNIILYNDFSKLVDKSGKLDRERISEIKMVPQKELLNRITDVFVESTMEKESLKRNHNQEQLSVVQPSDIVDIIPEPKMSEFRKIFRGFLSNNKKKDNDQSLND